MFRWVTCVTGSQATQNNLVKTFCVQFDDLQFVTLLTVLFVLLFIFCTCESMYKICSFQICEGYVIYSIPGGTCVLAAWWACTFSGILTWLGAQQNLSFKPCLLAGNALYNNWVTKDFFGFSIDIRALGALQESVQTVTDSFNFSSITDLTASKRPCGSAVTTLAPRS